MIIQPTMIATLFTLLLIVATSMIVNDYYDARSGVDYLKFVKKKRSPFEQQQNQQQDKSKNNVMKPLANGQVPMNVAKQFLSILYGILLVTISILPGSPTRLLAMGGSILTFYYTKHIKPKTWMKNVSCAILMSLTPLTSGYATLCHPFIKTLPMKNKLGFYMAWRGLSPLFCSLFCGFMGREIVMDCTDYDADKNAGINTVPVVHGKSMACKVVMLMWLASGMFMTIGPIMDFYSIILTRSWSIATIPIISKLIMALIGSALIAFRGIQLVLTEGRDEQMLENAIEETKLSMIFLLASSI
jgi:4-hydroxybenzoate polyprenyltransferase